MNERATASASAACTGWQMNAQPLVNFNGFKRKRNNFFYVRRFRRCGETTCVCQQFPFTLSLTACAIYTIFTHLYVLVRGRTSRHNRWSLCPKTEISTPRYRQKIVGDLFTKSGEREYQIHHASNICPVRLPRLVARGSTFSARRRSSR